MRHRSFSIPTGHNATKQTPV
uniref:Uncharacterized protein n=1 Tax=Arundo donax TaxID=35708 RepID=A0A0A9FDC7_ARUDO